MEIMGDVTAKECRVRDDLIVGDKLCTLLDVCDALKSCSSVGVLWKRLLELGRSLQVSETSLLPLQNGLTTDTKTYPDVLYEILRDWRSRESENASLNLLIGILEKKDLHDCAATVSNPTFCEEYDAANRKAEKLEVIAITRITNVEEIGFPLSPIKKLNYHAQLSAVYKTGIGLGWNKISDQLTFIHRLEFLSNTLRTRFISISNIDVLSTMKITKSTSWNTMSEKQKSLILNQLVLCQGKYVVFNELYQQAGNAVDQKLLIKLAKGEIPCVVFSQVPDVPEYYIPRTVKIRRKLNSSVIKQNCEDVFVIEGIEKHELSSLIEDSEIPDISGNQICSVTSRFIHLELEEDYHIICMLSPYPVHWLKYDSQEKEFEHVASSGSLKNLQKHLAELQHYFTEDHFGLKPNSVSILSDSPGMGKTMLLAKIANKILQQKPNTFVFFIVLKEIAQAFKDRSIDGDTIINFIAEQSSEFEFGRHLVTQALKTVTFVIMFDGYDEVLSSHVATAIKILQEVATIRNAVIFISTRPHYRGELENELHTLGYTIEPFNMSNQITFLTKFWAFKGAEMNESLNKFANACLKTIRSNLTDFERDIAGIPLQCRMLAETYEHHGIRCSKLGYKAYENPDSAILINSTFEMYDRYIASQLLKISKNKSFISRFTQKIFNKKNKHKTIKRAHIYYALELLFPEQVHQFRPMFSASSSISLKHLCGHGLLEATDLEDIRFVHRTFAEYLVASLVVMRTNFSETVLNFILLEIFSTESYSWDFKHPFGNNRFDAFKFKYPVICYFINGFAKKQYSHPDWNQKPGATFLNTDQLRNHTQILWASAHHNYEHIPLIFTEYFKKFKKSEFPWMANLLLFTAQFAGVEMMKSLCTGINLPKLKFPTAYKYSSTYVITPLHVAIARGHYNIAHFLVREFGDELVNLKSLFHFCVHESSGNVQSVLQDKLQIMKMLIAKSKQWIDEKCPNITPIQQSNVAVELLQFLIQEGADINWTNDGSCNKITLLHKIAQSVDVTPDFYHQVVVALCKRDFKHFNTQLEQMVCLNRERNYCTPLHSALDRIELHEQTIALFSTKSVDFNAVDRRGDSALFYAIRQQRTVRQVCTLIKYGADWKHTNQRGATALHVCAEHGNFEVLKYFLDTYPIDVDAQDNFSNTPLHSAVQHWSKRKHSETTQRYLIKKGANVNAKNYVKITPFLLAFYKSGISVSIIQEMEKHGLIINKVKASEALEKAMFNPYIHFETPNKVDHAFSIYTLIQRGGQADFKFTKNLLRWKNVQEKVLKLIDDTDINSDLLDNANVHGLVTENEMTEVLLMAMSDKSRRFYDIVCDKPGSFERLYVILWLNQFGQYQTDFNYDRQPFDVLDKIRIEAIQKLRSSIFVTPLHVLRGFRLGEIANNVMVLLTQNAELSIRRIKDTMDTEFTAIEEHDIENEIPKIDHFYILKCEVANKYNIRKMHTISNNFLCICKSIKTDVQGCKVVEDTYGWGDVSPFFLQKMLFKLDGSWYDASELFVNPNFLKEMGMSVVDQFMNNAACEIDYIQAGHLIRKDDFTDVHVSDTIFQQFLPEKLIFIHISKDELQRFVKFGNKIGEPEDDLDNLDFIIIQQKKQFVQMCKLAKPECNLHLIEYCDGSFKLLRSKGSDEVIRKFYETKQICIGFPLCSCSLMSDDIWLKISSRIRYKGASLIKNLPPILINARDFVTLSNVVEWFKVNKLFQHVSQNAIHSSQSLQTVDPDQLTFYSEQIAKLVKSLLTICKQYTSDFSSNLFEYIAVKQLFPELVKPCDIICSEICVNLGVLEYKQNCLVFIHNVLAEYLTAEMTVHSDITGFVCVEEMRNEVLRECFEAKRVQLKFEKIYSVFWKDIYSFKFIRSKLRLFEFIEFHLRNNQSSFTNYIKQNSKKSFVCKMIHACINGNFLKLLKLVIDLYIHEDPFETQDLVVIAVKNAGIPVIDLVTDFYVKSTGKELKDIKIQINYWKNDPIFFISVLHVAAMRGNHLVMKHLLTDCGFNKMLCQQHMKDIIHFCIRDTQSHPDQAISEIKLILDSLLSTQPNLIQETDENNVSALLLPNVHVDLVIHLVHLGMDVHCKDNGSRTILHLCSKYMTPEDYDKFVNFLHERDEIPKLFIITDAYLKTPLHHAVEHLEVSDSTIELLSSVGIDFNAVDCWELTPLSTAAHRRSARLLDTLIRYGADANHRGNNDKSVLHFACYVCNLSAVRYFILLGVDVNLMDKDNSTPLHTVLEQGECKKNLHEIVKVLVQSGADVNATNNFNLTPLSVALNREKGKIETITIELLKNAGAIAKEVVISPVNPFEIRVTYVNKF